MKNINKSVNFRNSNFWSSILEQKNILRKKNIQGLFLEDPNRFKKFSLQIKDFDLILDFSKQHLNEHVLDLLSCAAKHCQLDSKIKDLFNGKTLNLTEKKAAWHTSLRDFRLNTLEFNALSLQMDKLKNNLFNNNYRNVIFLGIGGSYLGPVMVDKALEKYQDPISKSLNFYFIANADMDTKSNILSKLDPTKTIVIINSKSFSTLETISNATEIINWLQQQAKNSQDLHQIYVNQIFAVTNNVAKALEFGIVADNIFYFREYIGGRYSIWSAVGISMIIKIGWNNFTRFLQGGYLIDQHFLNSDFLENIPVIMALISIWNINFMGYKSLAIIPYLDALEYLPSYLQQLVMESNGKNIDIENNYIEYDTAEIVFGGVGCNVQHSFMQMLHQGTQIIPVDFLLAVNNSETLVANCLAQSQALMQGNTSSEKFKSCVGSRPSTTILFPDLTPEMLGALIAIYEHKTFVQGVLWNINSFDQWGVELGKNIAKDLLPLISDPIKLKGLEINAVSTSSLIMSSTFGLINKYQMIKNIK